MNQSKAGNDIFIVTQIIVIIVARLLKVLSTDGTIRQETFVRIEPASIFFIKSTYPIMVDKPH